MIVVATLGDEYRHLEQWFGEGGYRLASRKLEYREGRAYDVLGVVAGKQTHTIWFDATAFRPRAPSTNPVTPMRANAPWLIPATVIAVLVGTQWLFGDEAT